MSKPKFTCSAIVSKIPMECGDFKVDPSIFEQYQEQVELMHLKILTEVYKQVYKKEPLETDFDKFTLVYEHTLLKQDYYLLVENVHIGKIVHTFNNNMITRITFEPKAEYTDEV